MEAIDPLKKNCVTVTGKLDAARSIIFVHGFGTDQSAWKDVATEFLDDFRVVLFDNVGAGHSIPEAFVQERYLNLHRYADDLLDICAALQLHDAILVGHSVGAMIGLLAAIKAPSFFARLVLIGASPRYLDDGPYHGGFTEKDLNELYRAVTTGYSDWADDFAPLAMANGDQPNLALRFAATIKSIPADRALTVLCSIFQSDHRADLAKLDKPTLLIHTREDVAVPAEVAGYLQQSIRCSRLVVIDATGHLPHLSAPFAVIGAMRDFVRDCASPA
jgi:sigma-B regulation protein RsbQ